MTVRLRRRFATRAPEETAEGDLDWLELLARQRAALALAADRPGLRLAHTYVASLRGYVLGVSGHPSQIEGTIATRINSPVSGPKAWKGPNNIITYIRQSGWKLLWTHIRMAVHLDGRPFVVENLHLASYNFIRHDPLGCARVRLRVAWKLPTVKRPRVYPGAFFVTCDEGWRPPWPGCLAMTQTPCLRSPFGECSRCPK